MLARAARAAARPRSAMLYSRRREAGRSRDAAGRAASKATATIEIARVAGLDDAGPGDLTFLANPKYASQVCRRRARRR